MFPFDQLGYEAKAVSKKRLKKITGYEATTVAYVNKAGNDQEKARAAAK
jgi:hypothetical protein